MAGLIPQSFIDDLLARTNIVDIVDARVPLKRAGTNLKACCPFHDEKTPSFTVNESKQFYYCFGCGAAGNALGFVMEYDSCSFPEAVETLAKPLGLEVPKDQEVKQKHDQLAPLLNILNEAQRFFSQSLRSHKAAKTAVNYLKSRGLTGQIAKDFGIGFAPPGWQNLIEAIPSNEALLVKGGMVIEADERSYDRFRNRIMFPIRNTKGNIVGFGGRVLQKEDQPKYLNSPETPAFNKSRELYGLFEAKRANRRLHQLLVVEGYMDVIALAQFGIRYGVATMGTAVGSSHLQSAFKYCKTITFCFDGDGAGRKAARKALEVSLPFADAEKTLRFMFLPEGHDPDSYIREIGQQAFEQTIESAQSLSEFLFSSSAEGQALNTVDQKAKFAANARKLIDLIPEGDYKQLMLSELEQRSGLATKTITTDENTYQEATSPEPPEWLDTPPVNEPPKLFIKRPPTPTAQSKTLSPEMRICALVLHSPQLANRIDLETHGITNTQAINWLNDIKEKVSTNPRLTTGALLGYTLKQEDNNFAKQLLKQEKLWPQSGAEAEFEQILSHLESRQTKDRYAEDLAKLKAKPFTTLSPQEKEELKRLLIETSKRN